MKALKLIVLLLVVWTSAASARLSGVRDLIERKEPGKALEALQQMLNDRPDDPWLLYNSGVAAYAAQDYSKADDIWQRLAGMEVPNDLREHIWTQIGNVSFRMAEPELVSKPENAVARLEQSREAYRVAIAQNRKNENAQKNLEFVEKQLELVYRRLADRLVAEAKANPELEKAIEKLQVGLDYQRNATALNPKDPDNQKREREIEELIASKLTDKATISERQADRTLDGKPGDEWRREAARENFDKALADFRQAQTYSPSHQPAKEGEERVSQKIADMLTQAGKSEQKKGMDQLASQPRSATEHLEKALEHFNEALAAKSDHAEAQKGKEDVQRALEQLHLKEGDKMTKAGEQQIKQDPATAADNLLGALDHFEQARSLNPENPEIPPRIEHVQKLLPEVMLALAQREQQRAGKSEKSGQIQQAVNQLERAEGGYDKVQQMQPENQAAQKGQQQVQADLERLRKNLAGQNKPAEQKPKPSKQESEQSFEAMLAQFKSRKEDREVNAKNRAGTKYEPPRSNGLRNW